MSFVFNIAKGRLAYYASLPASADALIAIPLETSGLESDSVLIDKDTFADVVSGSTNEQTTLGRKTLGSVTVTVDDANDRVNMDAADFTWSGSGGNPISAIVICYDPDTGSGTDSDLVPLTKHDFTATPDGLDITVTITDFARAA